MANGSRERATARKFAITSSGFRDLAQWLGGSGLEPTRIAIGCEPTGGWYSRTVAAWLEPQGYEINWLQNWAQGAFSNVGRRSDQGAGDHAVAGTLTKPRP
ncbi:MAG TPA: hypothetical protein VKK19_17015 [Candidatus Dormibacteraeota bacterium]|nr:hypothetical protein [Candidatus Dormibacteraeota bacterium]